MKWFGRKGATSESRPPLARAWFGLGWMGAGDWPQGYEAQLKAAVLANPVTQRALRLVSEAVGSAALNATAEVPAVAGEALRLVQRRSAGQSLVETLAAHILLHGNGYVQIGHGPDGRPTGLYALRLGEEREAYIIRATANGTVLRVWETTSARLTYAAAEIAADEAAAGAWPLRLDIRQLGTMGASRALLLDLP